MHIYTRLYRYYEIIIMFPSNSESMSNGVVFVGREKEIEDFRSVVNSLGDSGRAMLVEINIKLGNQRGMGYTQMQMGLLYAVLNKNEKAIEYTQKALEIFEKIGLGNDAKKAKAQIYENPGVKIS